MSIQIKFYQQDWIPGFAAFLNGSTIPNGKAFCVLNVGAIAGTVKKGDVKPSEVAYVVAESILHEIVHAVEEYCGAEFNEEKVEALVAKYSKAAESGEIGENNYNPKYRDCETVINYEGVSVYCRIDKGRGIWVYNDGERIIQLPAGLASLLGLSDLSTYTVNGSELIPPQTPKGDE